jgi:hypothetical protein
MLDGNEQSKRTRRCIAEGSVRMHTTIGGSQRTKCIFARVADWYEAATSEFARSKRRYSRIIPIG